MGYIIYAVESVISKVARLKHFKKQIEELKEMVSESHKKESVIFNLNIAMQNNEAAARDPVYEDKLEHIQSEWKGPVRYLTPHDLV